jgi:uncharacterized protein (DUF302 family)
MSSSETEPSGQATRSDGGQSGPGGVVTKTSPRPIHETVTRLTDMLDAKGMKVFAVIDQAAEAGEVGLHLRPTVLVLFGDPAVGTAVMDASPLAAVELPLKVLVWAEDDLTRVSYLAPAELGTRYGLSEDLVGSLAGINALTDAVVAP